MDTAPPKNGAVYHADSSALVARDPAVAVDWYRRAAEEGHLEAQLNLASFHLHATGVPPNEAEAAAWYGRAFEVLLQ